MSEKELPKEVMRVDGLSDLSALGETAWKDRGNAHLGNKELDDAADCYRQSIELNPRYAEAYNNLGYVYQLQNKFTEAVAHYRKAIELNPDLLPAQQNLGFALLNLGQNEAAEVSLRKVLELEPDHVEALQSLGAIAAQRGDLPQAEHLLRRAIGLQPDYVDAYNNLGILLKHTGRLCESESVYLRALELQPENASSHYNLGNLLMEANRTGEAEIAYRRAMEMKPDYVGAQYNLGILLLSLGRYTEAWKYYEHRHDPNSGNPICKSKPLPYPQWQGESLLGKSFLISFEQGLGDYIQFVRYAPLLQNRGVTFLTVLCMPPLKELLETVTGVDAVVTELNPLEKSFDYWTFPLSLPLHFGTTLETIPATFPYLHALPERTDRWRDRLPKAGFKVGLVWKGNADHKNDANRSLPGLKVLSTLWSVPGITFISLQKGQGEEEAKHPPVDQPLVHLGSDIDDFADTAAIIEQLDLVICVDTSIAHLAGAMNKPCWVLLPSVATDWRWLREREESPWYPSIRLFRQQESGKWGEPVERLRQALIAMKHAAVDGKDVSGSRLSHQIDS